MTMKIYELKGAMKKKFVEFFLQCLSVESKYYKSIFHQAYRRQGFGLNSVCQLMLSWNVTMRLMLPLMQEPIHNIVFHFLKPSNARGVAAFQV